MYVSKIKLCLNYKFSGKVFTKEKRVPKNYFPVKGEIIWYLSLTAWLISLSIMLSSSTHVITEGRSC